MNNLPPLSTDDETRRWVYTSKSRPCQRCGGTFSPRRMQFHHREGERRAFTIGTGQGLTRAELLTEMAKCDVLCRWCHADVHRRQK
jgi:hypothetical protein